MQETRWPFGYTPAARLSPRVPALKAYQCALHFLATRSEGLRHVLLQSVLLLVQGEQRRLSRWYHWIDVELHRCLPEPSPENKSEEHTSELQSQFHLVCRLLLEKKYIYYGNPRNLPGCDEPWLQLIHRGVS